MKYKVATSDDSKQTNTHTNAHFCSSVWSFCYFVKYTPSTWSPCFNSVLVTFFWL